jgi:hypothetical protein
MSISTHLPYVVYAVAAAAVATILYGLQRALAGADWPAAERTRVFRVSAVVLLGWLALSIVLGALGVYHVEATALPTIQFGIVPPILIGIYLIWRSDAVARLLDAVPQQWLIGVQLYRVIGGIFLIFYAAGQLPGLFAWPAAVGDVIVGLLAPIVGLAYARAPRDAAGLVRGWNIFGILDLVVAVGTGFMTSPSALQPIEVEPNSAMMTALPMVLIPVFLVPLAIVLHVASLAKLHRATARAGNGQGVARATA